ACRKAARQCRQASRSRCQIARAVKRGGGKDFLIKPPEEECPVLNQWSTNRKAAELVIRTRRFGETVIRLRGCHGVQNGVVLIHIDTAMPCVAAAFGDQVDHRTGVTSVLRAEIVGDDDILPHKLGITNKQCGPCDAVVIVVLTVDLLVVVAPAKSIHSEPAAAIGVREILISCRSYSRYEECQIVEALVLLNPGKARENGSGEGVCDLCLRSFNQGCCGRNFDGLGSSA